MQASRLNNKSIWKAGGTQTIGSRCEGIWPCSATSAINVTKPGGNVSEKRNWKVFATADEQSRREMITRSIGLGSVAMAQVEGRKTSSESPGTKTIITVKAILHELDFHSSPQRIYEALLDSKEFTAFSGGRAAEIRREVGG